MSRDEVRYIFGDLLPDLTGKAVVDVGSRLGATVYEVCKWGGGEPYRMCMYLIHV